MNNVLLYLPSKVILWEEWNVILKQWTLTITSVLSVKNSQIHNNILVNVKYCKISYPSPVQYIIIAYMAVFRNKKNLFMHMRYIWCFEMNYWSTTQTLNPAYQGFILGPSYARPGFLPGAVLVIQHDCITREFIMTFTISNILLYTSHAKVKISPTCAFR